MKELTEDDKKLLTEFLDECRHESDRCNCKAWDYSLCRLCGKIYKAQAEDSRSFTTWQDLGNLKEKLVEKEMWDEFIEWAYRNFAREIRRVRSGFRNQTVSEIDGPIELQFPLYLFNPSIFIPLVVEFLRKEKENGLL